MTPATWEIFIALRDHVERHPELVGRIGSTFLFRIGNARWLVDLKNSRGDVSEGGLGADSTIEMREGDFLELASGKAEPAALIAAGKLHISGDAVAPETLAFLRVDPELARAAVERARAAGQGPGITPSEAVVLAPRRPRSDT